MPTVQLNSVDKTTVTINQTPDIGPHDTINTITSNFKRNRHDKKLIESQTQEYHRSVQINEVTDGVSV